MTSISRFKAQGAIDVRDRFAVRRAGETIQTGSEHTCRQAVGLFNDHEQENGRTPDYWLSLSPVYEGYRELLDLARRVSDAKGTNQHSDIVALLNTRYRAAGEA